MDRIKRLNEKISDADSYETITINKYISINSRLHFFKAIKHLKNDSLPYLNTAFPFYHLKIPSQRPPQCCKLCLETTKNKRGSNQAKISLFPNLKSGYLYYKSQQKLNKSKTLLT